LKILLLLSYSILRWIVLFALILVLLLISLIEHPAVVLEIAKAPLKELGVSYGEVNGGLLSGFEINDVNYQDSIKAKKVHLKVDFEKLENRVLHVEELELEHLNIDRDYLSSLIDTNSSKNKEDSNSSLPFDKIEIDKANISLDNISYKDYFINSANFKVKNLKSDLKQQYIGDIYLLLDSNVTNLDLNASINNKKVRILATVEPKNHFLNTFVKEYNINFNSNPQFMLKANGEIDGKIEYYLDTKKLQLQQKEHQIESKKLLLVGSYGVDSKNSINHIDTELYGTMGEISLIADTKLNIDDINNTLSYQADLNTTIKDNFLTNMLEEQNLTFFASPKIQLKSRGNFKNLTYNLMAQNLNLKQNEYEVNSGKLLADGDYSILYKDVSLSLNTKFNSNVATPVSLDLDTKLNLNDINNSLRYKADLNTTVQDNFLTSILEEQNLSFLDSPDIKLKSEGNFEHLTYNLMADNLNLKYNEYKLNRGNLLADGDYSILHKDLSISLSTKLGSSVADPLSLDLDAKLNLDDINNTLNYRADLNTTIKDRFLTSMLQEQNLSFLDSPHITLKSEGNFEHLTYNLMADNLALNYNEYELNRGDLSAYGEYSIINKDVITTISTNLSTNVADPIKIDLDAKLNTDDINSSLEYRLKAHIAPKKEFVESKIPDNISIKKVAPLDIFADGTLLDTKFKINFDHLSASREDLDAEINSLSLRGNSNILTGDTIVDAYTKFDSTAGKGHIKDHLTINFNDVENTLKYEAKIEVDASSAYLNTLLDDKSLEVKGVPKIKLSLDGDMEKLTIQLNGQAEVMKDNNLSNINIQSSPIHLNLKEHTIDGKLKVTNDSKNLGLNFDTSFSGDYTNPKSLKVNGDFKLNSFNAFGINLDSLAPLKVKMRDSQDGTIFTIESKDAKRIKLHATTKDKDHFIFELKTGNLYLYKMMELPEALDHKFIKLDVKGEVTLSTQEFKLNGDIFSNKKFHAKIYSKNINNRFDATVKTKYLLVKAKGDIKNKKIEAKVTTDSLSELQNEFHSLYDFKMADIDGELSIVAKLDGEDVHANISSPELLFNGFNIEQLELDTLYTKELITLNKLNFKTTGFEDDSLNKEFYLNQKGLIHLGASRDVLIDMHPNIFVEMRGDENYLEGDFKITKLPLGHPSYGSMVLSTDVHYQQDGKRKNITGDIFLKKMKLFYEAKFLDADRDPDVVIITKADKKKEKSEDDFLENTAINLTIHAPEANYRTPDIDLLFDINVQAHKEYGKELSLGGKVEEINGRFDQVPKRFKIVRSNIVFKDGKKINPLLDIHVEYELPQVLININVGGSAERPKIEFSSEPPMPKKDIMSYLLLGVSTANFANGEGSVSREAELFIINQAARDLSYEVELDRLFVKDDGTGEGFAIEVGKKVSPKNMVIIETSKEGNSLILEHDISKNIKLRIGHHQKEKSSQSIDIFFRKRFK